MYSLKYTQQGLYLRGTCGVLAGYLRGTCGVLGGYLYGCSFLLHQCLQIFIYRKNDL